jgi:hypothetical protein
MLEDSDSASTKLRRPCRQNYVHDSHAAADRRDGDLGADGLGRQGRPNCPDARSGQARPELADLCLLSALIPERGETQIFGDMCGGEASCSLKRAAEPFMSTSGAITHFCDAGNFDYRG